MILDRIENASLYRNLGHRVAEAIDYLAQTNLADLPTGRQELDGDRLLAIAERYQGKPTSEARWEYHEKYLDVQFVVAGDELIGYAPWDDKLPVEQAYDPARDIGFVSAKGAMARVSAGMFAIFAPRELHAPGVAADPAKPDVFKIVMKCCWDE